jgi:hypothetical protein
VHGGFPESPLPHLRKTESYHYILDSLLTSVFQPRDYILCHPGVDLFQILIFHRQATGSERIYFQWEVTLAQETDRNRERKTRL